MAPPKRKGDHNAASSTPAPKKPEPLKSCYDDDGNYIIVNYGKEDKIKEVSDQFTEFYPLKFELTDEGKEIWREDQKLRELITSVENSDGVSLTSLSLSGQGYVVYSRKQDMFFPFDWLTISPNFMVSIFWKASPTASVEMREEEIDEKDDNKDKETDNRQKKDTEKREVSESDDDEKCETIAMIQELRHRNRAQEARIQELEELLANVEKMEDEAETQLHRQQSEELETVERVEARLKKKQTNLIRIRETSYQVTRFLREVSQLLKITKDIVLENNSQIDEEEDGQKEEKRKDYILTSLQMNGDQGQDCQEKLKELMEMIDELKIKVGV